MILSAGNCIYPGQRTTLHATFRSMRLLRLRSSHCAPNPKGSLLSQICYSARVVSRRHRAGALRDHSWDCNRHTFAGRLVMAAVDLRTVGELLGDRKAQMTKRYAHLSVSRKLAAVQRLFEVQSAHRTASGKWKSSGASRNLL